MMAPASYAHRRIAYNFCDLPNTAFAAQNLKLIAYVDVVVRTPGVRNFQPQPDGAMAPGVASYDLYSEDCRLVMDILSPSTPREVDLKLRRYSEAPDNLGVIVIEPRAFLARIYPKSCDWQPKILTAAEDRISMPEFGFDCAPADLYSDTPLDPLQA